MRRPGDYRDVFGILREAGIVGPELGSRMEEIAGFRNRRVHAYLDIDPGRVYEIVRGELRDVESLVATIVNRYLPPDP